MEEKNNWISVKDAAQELGYAPEYVASLCRTKKIAAKREGSTWSVDGSSVAAYKTLSLQERELRSKTLSRVLRKESKSKEATVKPRATYSWIKGAAIALSVWGVLSFGAYAFDRVPSAGVEGAASTVESPFFFLNPFSLFSNLFSLFTHAPQAPAPAVALAPTTGATTSPQTIVNNYNTTNNTTNNNSYHNDYAVSSSGISQTQLDNRINGLRQEISSALNSAPAPYSTGGSTNNLALTQIINRLDGVTISNSTVHGLSGLTASDIPPLEYLASSGGTIFGNLTLTGTCTGCGGGSVPGGSLSAVQFNDSGALGGDSTFTFATSSKELSVLNFVATDATTTFATSTSFFTTSFVSTHATSTDFFSTIASTSNLYGAGLNTCQGGFVLTYDGLGKFGCAADQTAAGQANPFTWENNYGVVAAATTSAFSAKNGVFASSTSHFANADFINATTTSLSIGSLSGLLNATNGVVGTIATSSLGLANFAFPFIPQTWGNSTSTLIGFGNGIISNASSTFTSTLTFSNFTSGSLAVNSSGGVYKGATTTFSTGITYSNGNVTCDTASASVFGCLTTTDWSTFNSKVSSSSLTASYPFPNNATSTALTFGGGLTTTNASTTNISGNTGVFGATGTTSVSSTGALTIQTLNGLLKATNGLVSTATAGTDYNNFAWPFTPNTNYAAAANSTSTPIWFTSGLQASSTSYLATGYFSGSLGVGTNTLGPNGLLQVAGDIGLSGTRYIRPASFADSDSLTFLGTQLVIGASNSAAYGYSGGGLIAARSNADGVKLLDLGRISGSANFTIQNTTVSEMSATFTGAGGNTVLSMLTNTGRVGFGTSTPYAQLSIHANSNGSYNPNLFAIASSSPTATSTLFSVNNIGSTTLYQIPSSLLKTNANGTIIGAIAGVDYATQSTISSFKDWQIINGYLTPTTTLGVIVNASSTIGSGAQASGLTIYGGATTTGSAYIAGNLQIGTSNSNARLDLGSGSLRVNYSIVNNPGIYGEIKHYGDVGGLVIENQNYSVDRSIRFLNGSNSSIAGTERMRIDTNGNVGIGSTSPLYKFSVEGISSLGNQAIAGYFTATTTTASTFPFASTTMITATNGLIALASSTIGNGNQNGGLTISGSATTTGNAYISGALTVQTNGSSLANTTIQNLLIGSGSVSFTGLQIASNEGFLSYGTSFQVDNSSANRALFAIQSNSTENVLFLLDNSQGKVGIGTTSPFAKVSIAAVSGDTAQTLFQISSSTAAFATSSLFSISNTGSTTLYQIPSSLLKTNSGGTIVGAIAGVDYAPGNVAFPFTPTTLGNSTSTLIQLNAGLISSASSTIGNGLRAGGLTISGGATTTGTAYFVGSVGVGTTSPTQTFSVNGDSYFAGKVGIGTSDAGINTLAVIGDAQFYSTTANSAVSIGRLGDGIFYNALDIYSGYNGSRPSLSLSQDTNGSIVRYAAGDALRFLDNTAGTDIERFRISAVGNVGIGTTTPYSSLSVEGSSALGNSATAGYFVATTSTASVLPFASTTAFTVSGTASTTNFIVSSAGGTAGCATFSTNGTISNTGVSCGTGSGGSFPFTPTTFGATTANSTSTLIGFTNGIYSLASSTIGNGNQNGGLTISGGATTTGNAYIAGNVGIGTVAPDYKLDVQGGNTRIQGQEYLQGIAGRVGVWLTNPSDNVFQLLRGSDSVSLLYVSSSGSVGIGTTSPYAKLSVEGASALGNSATAGYFVATTSTASIFQFASTTAVTATTASTTNLVISSAGGAAGCATFSTNGTISNTGVSCGTGSGGSFPFTPTALGNSTSTLIQLTAGFISSASSTVGDGSQTGGLTISGGATTTGNAYFAGKIGIGTTSPYVALSVIGDGLFGNPTGAGRELLISTFNTQSTAAGHDLNALLSTGAVTLSVGSVERLRANATGVGIGTSTPGTTLGVAGSAVISGPVTGQYFTATSTVTASTFPFASSTSATFSDTASTTALVISNSISGLLKTSATGLVSVATAGTDYSNFAWPFTPTTNFGAAANSTSTPIWFVNGLQASSTSRFTLIDFGDPGQSTSTLLSINGRQLLNASTSVGNFSFGLDSGSRITRGIGNTGFGYQALSVNATGQYNAAFGYQALASSTAGGTSPSTAVGAFSLASNTSGTLNTAVGYQSLKNNTSGLWNVAVGDSASLFNSSATGTVAVGYLAAAGTSAYFAEGYTAVGALAGRSLTTGGNYNTLVGYNSGTYLTSGSGNILIGAATDLNNLYNLTTGSGNIGIGYNTFFPSAITNNTLNIGGILFGSLPATSTAFTEATTGTIGVASSSPFAKFSIHADNGSTNQTLFAIGSSTVSATSTLFSINNVGSTTLYQIPSSILKTDANGTIIGAIAGVDYAKGNVAFPFTPTALGNATGTLLQLTAGVITSASSTIGGGTQITGLTISGGATTTGNAYISGTLGIGTTSAGTTLAVNGTGVINGALFSGLHTAPSFTATSTTAASTFPFASTTSLTASGTASTTALVISNSISGLLKTSATGLVSVATLGTDYVNFAWPFTPTALGNATGTLLQLTAGVITSASSTIGGGTNTTGLTIAGGATTTGTSYHFGNVGIGTTSAGTPLSVTGAGVFTGTVTAPIFFATSTATASTFTFASTTSITASGTASTTALVISNSISGLLKTSATGLVSVATVGTDYQTFAWPFTPAAFGNSTSTVIGFTQGIIANASSTFTSTLQFTNFTNGSLAVNSTGGVYTAATTTFGSGLTYNNGSVTANFPFTQTTFGVTNANATGTLIGFTNGIYTTNASTTNLSANTASFGATGTTSVSSTGALTIQTLSGLLKATNGAVSTATAGTDYQTFAWPFTPTALGNATGTLLQLTAGVITSASSTIGGGTNTTGLTIAGGATTTGTSYHFGNVGIGTTSAGTPLSVTGAGVFTGTVTAPSFVATSTSVASILPFASTTAITASGTASTTALVISNSISGLLKTSATGLVSVATAGTDYQTFAWPFTPAAFGNSTSTVIGFTQGIIANASSTFTSTLQFTNFTNGSLAVNSTGGVYTAATTTFSCSTGVACSTSSGVASFTNSYGYPFTGSVFSGTYTSATTTPLALQGGLYASSTVQFGNAGTSQFVWNTTTGSVGIGTTSPYAMLSIIATSTSGLGSPQTLFVIASTTSTFATSTLFSVSNTGSTTIGLFGSCSGSSALNTTAAGLVTCGAVTTSGGSAFPFTQTTFNGTNANATGTLIGFTNGIYTTNASTTNLSANTASFGATATTSISSTGVITSNATAAHTLNFASTTAISGTIFQFTTASSTNLNISGISACSGSSALTTNSSGIVACGGITSSAGAFPFTQTTYSGVNVNATSTALWLTATSPFSLIASSTFSTFSSTTQLTVSGGLMYFSSAATTTVVNNTPYAWTIATSTTGRPLLSIDTTSGSEQVSVGAGGAATTITIGDTGFNTTITYSGLSTSTILNGQDNAWSIATSSTNVPIISVSTRSSPVGLVGIGSTSPTAKLAVEMGSFRTSFIVANQGSTTPSLVVLGVNQNGFVGVGTSTPSAKFAIGGTPGVLSEQLFDVATSSNTSIFHITSSGLLGVGSTTPLATLAIQQAAAGTVARYAFIIGSSTMGTGSSTLFAVNNAGNVLIGTSTVQQPGVNLQVVGPISFVALTGTSTTGVDSALCLSSKSTGNIVAIRGGANNCTASTKAVKHDIASTTVGLEEVLKMDAVTFMYNDTQWDPTTHYGFIAEEADQLDKKLVQYDFDGKTPIGFQYENYTALLTNAVKDLNLDFQALAALSATTTASTTVTTTSFVDTFMTNLFGKVTSWLANAGNGIADLFATTIHAEVIYAKEVHTDTLCVGSTCVTQEQFLSIVQASQANTGAATVPAPVSLPPPPSDTTASTTTVTTATTTAPVVVSDAPASDTPPAPTADTPQETTLQ